MQSGIKDNFKYNIHYIFYDTMEKEKCSHCGYEWIKRKEETPVKCPECQRRHYGKGKNK